MNAQVANHETVVAQALALGLDLNGESTEEIQAMIGRAVAAELKKIRASLRTLNPMKRDL